MVSSAVNWSLEPDAGGFMLITVWLFFGALLDTSRKVYIVNSTVTCISNNFCHFIWKIDVFYKNMVCNKRLHTEEQNPTEI